MEQLLTSLRAAGEPTRLRLLNILSRYEMTVSELTQVLLQSQPRVSRHLKLMCEAGLLDRAQEGTTVFYRLAKEGIGAVLAQGLLRMMTEGDEEFLRDLERLESVRQHRAEVAAKYFSNVAADWDGLRQLYVAETDVEKSMLGIIGDRDIDTMLDVGTGTGRILQVFGDRILSGLGVDMSREMLAIARHKLEEQNYKHCQVRQGDVYDLPVTTGSIEVVTIHHVLHYLDDPANAIKEAARTIRAKGQLLIVDFARHSLDFLREQYSHHRLGFTDEEVFAWGKAAGLENPSVRRLSTGADPDKKLTVCIWTFSQNKDSHSHYKLEVA